MAYVAIKTTETYPLPSSQLTRFLWCQWLRWGHIDLQWPGLANLRSLVLWRRNLRDSPHSVQAKWGNQLSSILLVHRLGRVLAAGEALGQLCPVVSIATLLQVESLVPVYLLQRPQGECQELGSLSQSAFSIKHLKCHFSRSLMTLRTTIIKYS